VSVPPARSPATRTPQDTRTVTYVVETEQGIDTASFGGGDSFAAMVDATLADPRSWIGNKGGGDDAIAFRHISVSSSDTPTSGSG
jgi:hypothetical protein